MNLEHTPSSAMTYSPVMRAWCVLTAVAAFLTVLVGTLVTTFHVGMTDPLWPTAPWHLLLIDRVPNFGFYVEHTHRIVGYAIGICIVVQTIGFWWSSPRRWHAGAAIVLVLATGAALAVGMWLVKQAPQRSLAALVNPGFGAAVASALLFLLLTALEIQSRAAGRWQRAFVTFVYLGVLVQGMLGGLRVYLNELRGPELAVVHGLFAQVVFALSVLLAVMASSSWNSLLELLAEPRLRKLTLSTLVLVVVQIFFGGLLRHLSLPLAQRLHPMLAFAIAAAVALVLARIWVLGEGTAAVRRTALLLGILVGAQAVLGVEAWLRHLEAAASFRSVEVAEATYRSLHVLTGFGVFAAASALAARAWKAKLL